MYYDYLLTFGDEISLVWNAPFSVATALYLFIRYGALIDTTLGLILNVRPNTGAGFSLTSEE